jgi:hypothetical protein
MRIQNLTGFGKSHPDYAFTRRSPKWAVTTTIPMIIINVKYFFTTLLACRAMLYHPYLVGGG